MGENIKGIMSDSEFINTDLPVLTIKPGINLSVRGETGQYYSNWNLPTWWWGGITKSLNQFGKLKNIKLWAENSEN